MKWQLEWVGVWVVQKCGLMPWRVESEETRKRKRGEAKRRRENKCVCAHKK